MFESAPTSQIRVFRANGKSSIKSVFGPDLECHWEGRNVFSIDRPLVLDKRIILECDKAVLVRHSSAYRGNTS